MFYKNGDKCQATWERNEMYDQGFYIWENGTQAKVKFLLGQMAINSPLIFSDEDFRKEYKGPVQNGIPHGPGTLILKNGKIFTGEWVDGILSEHA